MKSTLNNLGDLLHSCSSRQGTVREIDPENMLQRMYTTERLESMSQAVATHLSQMGLQPRERMAIISDNCLEFIICYLAILKLGAVAVMISSKMTQHQIDKMLDDGRIKLIFSDRSLNTDLPVLDFKQGLSQFMIDRPFKSYRPQEQQPAVIMHTSGSTGVPSRVVITHQARIGIFGAITNRQTTLLANPLYHSLGINSLDFNLHNQNDLIFLKKFEPVAYLKTIDCYRPRSLVGVPSMFALLTLQHKLISTLNLSSVEHITLAGGPATQNLVNNLSRIFINAKIHIGYGSTELGPTVFGLHDNLPTPPSSVGCERPGFLYRIVDDVLQVQSPSMMKEYDDKRSNFTSDGYYITNDMFRKDQDGFYYFIGRSDDMFKSGGNKLFPSEIEQVVEQHPYVDKCVVIPVPDYVKEFKPYAFVTVTDPAKITEHSLQDFLIDKLARYQLPRHIWIVESIPINSVNKIDKHKLTLLAEKNLAI